MIFSELRELSKRGQLAPWHEIARRLLAWPFYMGFRCLMVAALFLGWGASTGRRAWKDTQ